VGGAHAGDYREPFAAFTARVDEALARAVARDGTTLVVTSGGPVSWVCTALLGGASELWSRLNVVCVNAGVTKLVTGRRGVTLVSFNEHTHLEGEPGLLTYR
jgi:broad specificity phosphatase PhoE